MFVPKGCFVLKPAERVKSRVERESNINCFLCWGQDMVYIFYSDHSKCQYVPIRPQDNTTAQTLLLPSAAATHHRPFRAWRLAPSWRRKPKHSSTPHADWLFRARCSFLAADWLNVVGGIHAEYHCNSRRWAVHQRILTTTDPAKSVSAKEKIS